MTKEEKSECLAKLNEITGSDIYVICCHNGILRSSQCAYFASTSEEGAAELFEILKPDLPYTDNYKTVKAAITDISILGLLFAIDNFESFCIKEIGMIPSEVLYGIRPEVVKKVRDILKAGPLYVPLDDKGTGICRDMGKVNIVQSFYSDAESCDRISKDNHELSYFDLNGSAKILDPFVYTVDDMLVYGAELKRAYEAAMFDDAVNYFDRERIAGIIEENGGLYVVAKDGDIEDQAHFCGLSMVCLTKEDAEGSAENCNGYYGYEPGTYRPLKITSDDYEFEDGYVAVSDGEDLYVVFARDINDVMQGDNLIISGTIKRFRDLAGSGTFYAAIRNAEPGRDRPGAWEDSHESLYSIIGTSPEAIYIELENREEEEDFGIGRFGDRGSRTDIEAFLRVAKSFGIEYMVVLLPGADDPENIIEACLEMDEMLSALEIYDDELPEGTGFFNEGYAKFFELPRIEYNP